MYNLFKGGDILKDKLIDDVINQVSGCLNKEQIQALKMAFFLVAKDYEITKQCTEIAENSRDYMEYLFLFLSHKRSEGCSEETIEQYKLHLKLLLDTLNKQIIDISTDDLYTYLAKYKHERKISNRSLDHKRRVFNTFFGWLCRKKYLGTNPAWGLDRINYNSTIKKPYSDEEREVLRCTCEIERDLAIIDLLYSSAIRVGELVKLNITDVNIKGRSLVVLGKGGKEREAYISATSALHLQNYINSRADNNPALFVSLNKMNKRLTRAGIQAILRRLGKKANILKVHPHRYRRTALTNAVNRGMPVQEAQALAGHSDINTTMIYCTVYKESLKFSHNKCLSA